ncbi:hypothetical protein, partial [Hyphomonas sp.]|uniref:hypothetical protein n=1 Tax=Hyphomonas sp. TaxID=87 RepID=UPI0039E31B4F
PSSHFSAAMPPQVSPCALTGTGWTKGWTVSAGGGALQAAASMRIEHRSVDAVNRMDSPQKSV